MANSNLSVGFVISHPFHGSPGSVLRVRELSRGLSNLGVKVHIYTPYMPNQNWGKNITFHRLPSTASTLKLNETAYNLTRRVINNRFLIKIVLSQRLLDNQINNLAKSLIETIKEDIDILQGEQELAAAACVKAGKEIGVPVVSSLHNIWPEELVVMNLIEKASDQFDLLFDLEKSIAEKSDLVVVVSKEMESYLKSNFFPTKIAVIPPGGRSKPNYLISKTSSFKIIYSGLVVPRAHVDLLVKSIPYVLEKYPNAEFFITEKGEDLQKIRKLAKQIKVSPTFYWFSSDDEFYQFLSSCKVGIVTSSDDLPRRLGPAVKLFDYLSVGLPVVANDIGGWTNLIADEKIGILTNDDPKSFSQGIITLLDNQVMHKQFSENASRLITKKMNWDFSAKVLLEKYEALLS